MTAASSVSPPKLGAKRADYSVYIYTCVYNAFQSSLLQREFALSIAASTAKTHKKKNKWTKKEEFHFGQWFMSDWGSKKEGGGEGWRFG